MSRLPRPHSSERQLAGQSSAPRQPSAPQQSSATSSMSSTMRSSTLKRKAADEDDLPRRKLTAIAENGDSKQPLRPSRTGTNLTTAKGRGPPPATKPTGPNLSTSTRTRASSAPPKSIAPRPNSSTSRAVVRPTTSRPTPSTVNRTDDHRFKALQDQVSTLNTVRAADTARLTADMEAERLKLQELQANHLAISRELVAVKSQELIQRRDLCNATDELDQLKARHAREVEGLEMDMRKKDRELRDLKEDLRLCQDDLERERGTVSTLKATISAQSTAQLSLSTQVSALQAQISALHAALDAASGSNSNLGLQLERANARVAELERETREAESARRKLHNMVQELKGNIRVFCRVRPLLPSDVSPDAIVKSTSSGAIRSTSTPSPPPEDDEARREKAMASILYPDRMDHKEIVLSSSSESATGQERRDQWAFNFDRVFEPDATQAEVFEEISQLAQSCTDGYNVCVFAYGQTGSGKSFTMEGGPTETTAGMIPRAVEQVFRVTDDLKSKGWEYTMEGQFVEIYNETINDLLGKAEFDKKKHEIKHDKSGRTTITDVNVVPLSSPSQVRALLVLAQSRRTVAATLMNERSSRSHSVFTLRIRGMNSMTDEVCEGSLNLVDLAGSERLEKSGAAGDRDRLKETQNINKSLSALGDVIAALGEKGEGKGDKHIPYRNSKLTYLLQNSLSGNSKTLMVLNLSPLAYHINESLCSLRFATKVNNTTIGTAKKQIKP